MYIGMQQGIILKVYIICYFSAYRGFVTILRHKQSVHSASAVITDSLHFVFLLPAFQTECKWWTNFLSFHLLCSSQQMDLLWLHYVCQIGLSPMLEVNNILPTFFRISKLINLNFEMSYFRQHKNWIIKKLYDIKKQAY